MKYILLGFGSLCLLWACEQMDIDIDPIDPISGCEGKELERDYYQPILYDSSSFVIGTINGKPYRPSINRMRYEKVGTAHNVNFSLIDSMGCEWFRWIKTTVNSHFSWYRAVGDTIFLSDASGPHVSILYRAENRFELFRLINGDSTGLEPLDNFATIHSISEDTIIEGSFHLKLRNGLPPHDSIVTIKVDRFRLKPTF